MDTEKFWFVEHQCHQTRGELRHATREAARSAGRNRCHGGGKGSAPAPDPNIGIAALQNADLSKEMAGVARDELAFNRQQWEESKPVYQAVAQAGLDQMHSDTDRANQQWDQYKTLFQPVEQQVVQDASTYDSPARKEQMAARAAADVSSSYDAAQGVTQRNMQSMGVNPTDPKYAAVMQQAALGRARDTAGAMTNARTNTELTGMSMRQGAAQLGRNLTGTSVAQDAASLGAGSAATSTTTQNAAARNAAVGAASPWYSGAVNANTQAGNLYNQQYGNQLQAYNAKQNSGAGFGQLIGAGLGAWASTGFATKDGGLVRRNSVEGTPGGDGAPLRTAINTPALSNEAGEPIEGEYTHVDEASIDPTDGEILDAIGRDAKYGGMPRRGMTPDGMVNGPGSATSDSVPARLSAGEAVLNASAVQIIGEDAVHRLNAAGLQRRRGGQDASLKYETPPLKNRAYA